MRSMPCNELTNALSGPIVVIFPADSVLGKGSRLASNSRVQIWRSFRGKFVGLRQTTRKTASEIVSCCVRN